MLKLENSIRGLSFSRVAFDLTIQGVNQDFPKLKRRDIPKAIKSISYTLDIDAIMDFNICPGEIKWE